MSTPDIARQRLVNQQIGVQRFDTVENLVAYMGAIQAQDFGMAKWAIGLRVPGCTHTNVEAAMAAGLVIRTHVLRPTWHFIAAKDARWMLALTAPRIRSKMGTNDRLLGLDQSVLAKSARLLEKLFKDGGYFTRDEIRTALAGGGLDVSEHRLSHMLAHAELSALICSGPVISRKNTYAWLDAHIFTGKTLSDADAQAELVKRYFTSHGPATLHDFSWWSGLTLSQSKAGMEAVEASFSLEKKSGETYYYPQMAATGPEESIHFLPAFDEFLVGYANRSASLHNKHLKKIVTINGMFFPVVVVNGQVKGLWKKTAAGIEVSSFLKKDDPGKRTIKKAAERLAGFYR